MNAAVADNVATIVFDVIVDPDLPDGTILSNQAFVDRRRLGHRRPTVRRSAHAGGR